MHPPYQGSKPRHPEIVRSLAVSSQLNINDASVDIGFRVFRLDYDGLVICPAGGLVISSHGERAALSK